MSSRSSTSKTGRSNSATALVLACAILAGCKGKVATVSIDTYGTMHITDSINWPDYPGVAIWGGQNRDVLVRVRDTSDGSIVSIARNRPDLKDGTLIQPCWVVELNGLPAGYYEAKVFFNGNEVRGSGAEFAFDAPAEFLPERQPPPPAPDFELPGMAS